MLMFNQWWLPHAKNYIKLTDLNPQTKTCLGCTQVKAYRELYIWWRTILDFYVVQQNRTILFLNFPSHKGAPFTPQSIAFQIKCYDFTENQNKNICFCRIKTFVLFSLRFGNLLIGGSFRINSHRALRVDEGKPWKTSLHCSVLRYGLNVKLRLSSVSKGVDYNLREID